MGMRTMSADGNIEYATSEGFVEAEPVHVSMRKYMMLRRTAKFYLEWLPKDEDGEVRTTTLQSRNTRTLCGPVKVGSKARLRVMAAKERNDEASELDICIAELSDEFKLENAKLREVTKKGHGDVHFRNTKMLVEEVLENAGFDPDHLVSHALPHNTEMRAIGEELGSWSDTETGKNGEDVVVEYTEESTHKYDGIDELKMKGREEGSPEYKAWWCRQLEVTVTVEVMDADGKVTTKEVCVLEPPKDQWGGTFWSEMDKKWYPANWHFSAEFMHPMNTGANFHNLGNQAIIFAHAAEAIEEISEAIDTLAEKVENSKGSAKKKAKEQLKKIAPIKGYLQKQLGRSRYELVVQSIMNFRMKAHKYQIGKLVALGMNESYSQNPIGLDDQLMKMQQKHRRELPANFPIHGKLKEMQKKAENLTDDDVREIVEFMGTLDPSKLLCRIDGKATDWGKGPGLIFNLKSAMVDGMWKQDVDEDEDFAHLTAKQRHLVETVRNRTKHVREQQKPVEDCEKVQALTPKNK